jgi:competence protein ComEA
MKLRFVLLAILLLSLSFTSRAADKALEKDTADKKPAAVQSEQSSGDKLDINTATEQQLIDLPGVGEARAKAIIKGRPYRQKDELVERKILPQSVYDDIKAQIIAKQK